MTGTAAKTDGVADGPKSQSTLNLELLNLELLILLNLLNLAGVFKPATKDRVITRPMH